MSPMIRRPPGIELALLGFLKAGPQHGYQIYQIISDPDGLGPTWHLKQSQLYALLTKLEKDGYIRGNLEIQESAHPPRRMYQLTAAGKAAFQNWLSSPVSAPRLIRQEFLVKLYLVRQEGSLQAAALIELQRANCQQWLQRMKSEKIGKSAFNQMVYQYRIGQIEAVLAWLDLCLQNLAGLP